MRRTLPLVALALLLAAPLASAQGPDPGELVAQACGLVGDARERIPLCPQEEPAAPQQAQAPEAEAAHEHATPEAAQEAVQTLADEGVGTVQGVVEEPASAPDRVVAFVAGVLQFLKDLLGLGASGLAAVGSGFVDGATFVADLAGRAVDAAGSGLQATGDAFAAAGQAVADAASAAQGALGEAVSALGSLLSGGAPQDAAPARGLAPATGAPAVDGAAKDLLGLLPSA